MNRPKDMNLTDNQWFNFICGLLSGRYIKRKSLKAEMNGTAAEINTADNDNTYSLLFVTNCDGDASTHGSVSVYLRGGSAAESLTLQNMKIEVALTNPGYQPVVRLDSASQSSAPDNYLYNSDFILNHCPIVDEQLTNETVNLAVIQEYRPATATTDSSGAVTYTHEHNLVVSIADTINAEPNMLTRLFDLDLTWKDTESLLLDDPAETVQTPYLAGDISVEDGLNTSAVVGTSIMKLPTRSASLVFGNPQSRTNQNTISALAQRGASYPTSVTVSCSPQQASKYQGGYIEYRGTTPYTNTGTSWRYASACGLGGTWTVPENTTPDTVVEWRHRVYPVNNGVYDTEVICYSPTGEVTRQVLEMEIVPAPAAPRPATARYRYADERLSLHDECFITISRRPTPSDINEGLVLTDDVRIHVKHDNNYIIQSSLTLNDTASILVRTTPDPDANNQGLILHDNASISIS